MVVEAGRDARVQGSGESEGWRRRRKRGVGEDEPPPEKAEKHLQASYSIETN